MWKTYIAGKIVRTICFFALVSALVTACDKTPQPQPVQKPLPRETLRIGIIPEQNVFEQKKRYLPLMEYLSNALDMNFRIKLLDSYGSIHEELKNGNIDGAFFGSFNYVIARARTDIEPLVRPVDSSGNSVYRGTIFTRRDSGISADVKGWRGKRIALVHEVTTAGYIFPRWYLKRHGVKDFEKYFRKITFTGSHDAAILSVMKGQADIGAAKDLIYNGLLAHNPAMRSELVIIANSIEVPSNSLCVRGGLDKNVKDRLKKTLLSLHEDPEGKKALAALGAGKFTGTTDAEYSSLRQMASEVGIDIKTYAVKE